MKLKRLLIHRGFGSHPMSDPLRGEIEFVDENKTELKLALDDEFSRAIVALAAEAITRAGRAAAEALAVEAFAVTAIEHQPEDDEGET